MPLLGAGRRVIAPDTLGFGNSDPAPAEISLGFFADNVLDVLDALGIEQCDLFGAMTGSRIALHVAATAPGRVRRLALLGFPYFASEGAKEARLAETARFELGYPEPDGSHVLRVWKYALAQLAGSGADHAASGADPQVWRSERTGGPSPIADLSARQMDYLEDWVTDVVRCKTMWTRTALAVYKDDPGAELPSLTVPTLVIGLNGSGFPPYLKFDSARAVGSLVPNGRFVMMEAPDADSRVTYLYPEELSRVLATFLDDPSSS
jgi:pimeloyl-ACP methyl ester carboxylesterase